MSDHYMLIGQTPVPSDLMTWARWFEDSRLERVVKQTWVMGELCWVSTVFLGLDHQFCPGGPPILFETMAFWGGEGYEQERCSTWLEAEAQHAAMIAHVLTPRVVLTAVWRACREAWERMWREFPELRERPLTEWEEMEERLRSV
jgi:hypothetical protein